MAETIRIPEDAYFAVSPLMLFAHTQGNFEVYLRQDGGFVLYTRTGEQFTPAHKRTMHEAGVREVFVLREQSARFRRYVEENLGAILANEDLPVRERAGIFYDVSVSIVRQAFTRRLPEVMGEAEFARIRRMVRGCTAFLSRGEGLRAVGGLIGHDYKLYRHSINVLVFALAIMRTYEVDEESLVECGLGAILHDIGKTSVPREILERPVKLSPRDKDILRTHPVRGAALCAGMPLSGEVLNVILFHHEKHDGSGYPSGIAAQSLPLMVRVVAVADKYENLISGPRWQAGLSPFLALRALSERYKGKYDPDVIRRLVLVLSGAGLAGEGAPGQDEAREGGQG
jgi:putative nucleotidyltransferase with HDIG domain